MKTRLILGSLLSYITVVCLAAAAAAQTEDSKTTIAPYLDSQTILVGRLNVEKLPLADIRERAIPFLQDLVGDPSANPKIEATAQELSSVRDSFLQAGGREVYVVFSLFDIPNPPFFVVTASAPDKLEGLETFVRGLTKQSGARLEVRARKAIGCW